MLKWLSSLVDSNEKQIKKLQPAVDRIKTLEPVYEKLTAEELREKTAEFKYRIAAATGESQSKLVAAREKLTAANERLGLVENEYDRDEASVAVKQLQEAVKQSENEAWKRENDALDEILPEAFAAVREAAKRGIGQRAFDTQLMGGMVLHQGKIAEMKTGEGKTLVATFPLYLNSLTGKGVHLVTVNDYLSKRDPHWMGPIFSALGVSVSSIQGQQAAGTQSGVSFIFDLSYQTEDINDRWPHMRPVTRKEAYQADIVYGTNNEFGFDYLRDNMVVDLKQMVQRDLNYAIVDEVDNILIDEARTPLIISGPAEEGASARYQIFARLIPLLKAEEDYVVDEKHQSANLTDAGITKMEGWLQSQGVLNSPNLYDPANAILSRYLDNALKAQTLFHRDREYVVEKGQIIIVDEFTGRKMHGRRYSEGLHQAIEAKEHVRVQEESRTYATITFQNYFRMYKKLAGMTGTAVTEAEEFHKIYKLEVVEIPTNKPMARRDLPDQIFKDETSKFEAVVKQVEELNKTRAPILIGTISIEKSEVLSDMLRRRGIKHEVLNAKQHEREAMIIAQAGRLGAVTVATNMAGRGVDIILGGNPEGEDPVKWQKEHDEVVSLGGLHVIGTERHEARRIDNQLRGRAGRQGDPGSSRFYVSLEDDIMRRFGGDRVKGIMEWAGLGKDVAIENRLVSGSIESAQTRVEGYHFDMRKHLVEYDDVVNTQREIIYTDRRKILSGADLKANILSMVEEEISGIVEAHTQDENDVAGEMNKLIAEVKTVVPLPGDINPQSIAGLKPDEIIEKIMATARELYTQMENNVGAENMRKVERLVMLRELDNQWVNHLTEMDEMRTGVGLQAVAQRNPLAVYKNEGEKLFRGMQASVSHALAHTIFRLNVQVNRETPARQTVSPMARVVASNRGNETKPEAKVAGKKVGRNDPCPCGSGKKYKHCCGS